MNRYKSTENLSVDLVQSDSTKLYPIVSANVLEIDDGEIKIFNIGELHTRGELHPGDALFSSDIINTLLQQTEILLFYEGPTGYGLNSGKITRNRESFLSRLHNHAHLYPMRMFDVNQRSEMENYLFNCSQTMLLMHLILEEGVAQFSEEITQKERLDKELTLVLSTIQEFFLSDDYRSFTFKNLISNHCQVGLIRFGCRPTKKQIEYIDQLCFNVCEKLTMLYFNQPGSHFIVQDNVRALRYASNEREIKYSAVFWLTRAFPLLEALIICIIKSLQYLKPPNVNYSKWIFWAGVYHTSALSKCFEWVDSGSPSKLLDYKYRGYISLKNFGKVVRELGDPNIYDIFSKGFYFYKRHENSDYIDTFRDGKSIVKETFKNQRPWLPLAAGPARHTKKQRSKRLKRLKKK